MKKIHNSIVLIILAALTGGSVFAQDKSLSEVIDVIRPYKPVLADAVKIKSNPEINDKDIYKAEVEYQVKPIKLDSNYKSGLVAPEKPGKETVPKLFTSYLKAGMGNRWNNLFDFTINNSQNKDWQWGLISHHLGASGKPSDMSFNEQSAHVFAKRIFYGATWGGGFGYDRASTYFYGYDHSDTAFAKFNKKDLRQRFHTFEAQTEVLTTNKKNDALNFGLTAKTYYMYDFYKANETGLKSDLFFDKRYDRNVFNLGVSADFSKYNDSIDVTNGLLKITPSYSLKKDSTSYMKIGLMVATEFGQAQKVHAYPIAHLEYTVIPQYFVPFGGVYGNSTKNSFRSYSTENPYLSNRITLRNTHEKIALYAGFTTHYKAAYLKTQLTYSVIDSLPLFITDSADTKRFVVVYDGKNSIRTTFTTEMQYHFSEKIRTWARADLYAYNTSKQLHAWNLPSGKLQVGFQYNIAKKFIAHANIYSIGKRYARLDNSAAVNTPSRVLKPVTDLNVSLEYRYSKTLSFFTRFNNIAGMKYERWLNYPAYGFNFLAGLTFAL